MIVVGISNQIVFGKTCGIREVKYNAWNKSI